MSGALRAPVRRWRVSPDFLFFVPESNDAKCKNCEAAITADAPPKGTP